MVEKYSALAFQRDDNSESPDRMPSRHHPFIGKLGANSPSKFIAILQKIVWKLVTGGIVGWENCVSAVTPS